jgi:predicted RNA-binding Zn-ribbon protein involved in translation (DUF1610 family)
MPSQCVQCGAELESPWKFCPLCGAAHPIAAPPIEGREETLPWEHEKAPVQGAFGGLVFGILAVPVLIIPGALLCLTGLGAFLGIPMIIAGVLAPLLGPMMGLGVLNGNCPWCDASISGLEHSKDFSCPECGKRIAVKHREFMTAA